MLIPQTVTLTAYRGATFNEQINFWQDTDHTTPFDFSPWNVSITATMGTSTVSLSFSISGGAMILSMTPAQTAAANAAPYHIVITLTATTGSPPEVEYLAHGTMTFVDP